MDEKPIKTDNQRYNDEKTGQFKEGNPGRPDGCKNKFTIAKLEEAIKEEEELAKEEKGGVGIFRKFIKMAYINPVVMIALMRKFIPDKEKIEHSTDGPLEISIKRVDVEDRS